MLVLITQKRALVKIHQTLHSCHKSYLIQDSFSYAFHFCPSLPLKLACVYIAAVPVSFYLSGTDARNVVSLPATNFPPSLPCLNIGSREMEH